MDLLARVAALRGRGSRVLKAWLLEAAVFRLVAEFQTVCRDLHTEAVDRLLADLPPSARTSLIRDRFLKNRALDRGNPTPAGIATDFAPLGCDPWSRGRTRSRTGRLRGRLEHLLQIRNILAHEGGGRGGRGGDHVTLERIRIWCRTCNALAEALALATQQLPVDPTASTPVC